MFSMEIDLELPSYDHDKVDSASNANGEIMSTADELDVADDEEIPPTEHNIEVYRLNAFDNFTANEEHIDNDTVGADAFDKEAKIEPRNGLTFETKEAAYSFYREYARSVGFGITIKASRRSKKSGKFIDVKIACSRFGSKRDSSMAVNPRSCIKTDCKAGMHMKRTQDEKWIIHSIVKEHNHEICLDDFNNAIRGRSKQSGVVPCQKKGLQLALDVDDVQFMLAHFTDMQAENPNFFYAIDLDHEKRMRNVFWVDAKGRQDYSMFYDVVFLDTYYVRDNYKIPFVPIVGVNNHFQFTLLGCALIGEQTTSNFVWLMRTWRKAVSGEAPSVVITDQDKFLNEAIADVFPDSHHCFCLWHILSKMPEKLFGIMNQTEPFMSKFNKCIYSSWTEEQFQKRWWKMVDKFRLREDGWFQSLYENRKKWVPTYMRDFSLAGISTTERSGSIASFFDAYIGKEASLKEIMEQYKIFLRDSYEMEAKADFDTQNKQPALRSLSAFEKQLSTIYTDAIFKKFQVEVLGVVSCGLQRESENGTTLNFRVDDFEERQIFFVSWKDPTSVICCSCHSFEYRGYLCKHAILVLQVSGVSTIPSHYILKRWTKYAKISQAITEVSNSLHHRMQRFNDLCKQAIKLGEQGSLSQEAYDIAFQALHEALEKSVGANNSTRSVFEPSILAVSGFLGTEAANHCNMTKSSKKKKMYKKNKVRSEPGGTTIGLLDSCEPMAHMNSRAHSNDHCYVPQQDVQEMALGSRTPILEGYNGSQQSMHGLGQLNTTSPIRDGYFDNQHGLPGQGQIHPMPTHNSQFGSQQSMQGLSQLSFRAPTMQGSFDIHDNL